MNNQIDDKDAIKKFNLKSILDKIKNNKKFQLVIIAVCVVLLLVILFGNYNNDNKETVFTSENYVSDLESRLSKTLSNVKGAGKVSVVITVESGMETVLAMKVEKTESQSGIEIVETPLIVNGKTITVKELYPKIIGVLIVAEGANDISVLSKIQQATISLLDINVNQIEILSMK